MTTNTILDTYEAAQASPWFIRVLQRRPAPTALQLAVSALEACRRDQLEHAEKREFYAATEGMLRERERRLLRDIERLSTAKQHPTETGM